MNITHHNIPGAPAPTGYCHATVAETGKIVFLSGQVGADEKGTLPPGLSDQIKNALVNMGHACTAAGADVRNIVKVTFYVVNWNVTMMQHIIEGTTAAKEVYNFPDTALTLISVNGLFTPDMLVEIEGVAVI
ncbi:MAG: RidA family protein [Chitinophagaceae bacterium]|nr:RidA family protein [Chitinophagaceae bacterium]